MGKLWKGKNGQEGSSMQRSKSIRGQISAPVPIAKAPVEPPIYEDPGMHFHSQDSGYHSNASIPRFQEHLVDNTNDHWQSVSRQYSHELPAVEVNEAEQFIAAHNNRTKRDSSMGFSSKNIPQRKKSTIRGAFGKLFGGKKRETNLEALYEDSDRNYVTSPSRNRYYESNEASQPRTLNHSASAHFAYQNYTETQSQHIIAELQAAERPKTANTDILPRLSSRFSVRSPHAHALREATVEPEPELPVPLSPVRSESEASFYDTIDEPEDIGMAISNDFHTLKRRSRSLSVLPNLSSAQTESRRRSEDTIARRDHLGIDQELKSPMSGTYPTEEELKAFSLELPETKPTPAPVEAVAPEPISKDVTSDESLVDELPLEDEPVYAEVVEAPIPTETETVEPSSTEAEPADETPAAADKPAVTAELEAIQAPSLSERVLTMEDRLSRLEIAVIPDSEDSSLRSRTPPGLTVDHINSLLDLLETERAARIDLETQVSYLAHQVTYLLTSGTPAPGMAYVPVPSEPSPGHTSAFDDDDDDDDGMDSDEMEEYLLPYSPPPRSGLAPVTNVFGKEDDAASEVYVATHDGPERYIVYDEHEPHAVSEARVVSFSHVSMNGIPAMI
ncbi:hypothetical protein VHEMI10500 [[Torrubiella] hemipterigena]|uniref:Uncharacterized protein n=1 Tax=[Torrubiella] hemipterigena TaxID=1531966 RepID=A0A0A1TD77_9HYPO|nr:hypothetical protein VHEMI10500 [[Torrubiella] hemipterigena]